MSNILIIKHGSLGDIAQASGAIQDISDNHPNDDLYILSTKPYYDLLKKNPNITDVILDKRLSRFNLIYLYLLMRKIKNINLLKFTTFKILKELVFIKIFSFQKQGQIFGHQQKLHFLKELVRLILIKTLY